jgi:aspartyl-tRNA(Asn)/glutamyl-tRNA(Gln) amidotransferase subunit A
MRLAVLKDFVLDGLEDKVAADFDRALTALSGQGAAIGEMAFAELRDLPAINAKGGIVAAEAVHVHRALIAEKGAAYDPRVKSRIAAAETISAADYLDYIARRRAMIASFADRFQGFDAVLLPTVLNTPPVQAELAGDKDYLRYNAMSLRNTYVGNFLNGCAISLPMHREGTAPSGLMAMAPWGKDRALFGVAAAVERGISSTRG